MALKTITYGQTCFELSYSLPPAQTKTKQSILLLHGWGSNKQIMQQAFGHSFAPYQHIYLDLPGFGNSPSPSFALNTHDYAQIIKIFLQQIHTTPHIILGHSFGGKIASLLNPPHLILLSSAGIPRPKSLQTKLKIYCAKLLKIIHIKALQKRLRSSDAREMDEVMYQTFKRVVDENFEDVFANFCHKGFIFWGKDDTTTPLDSGERIHKLMRDSAFFVLEGDHFFFLHQAKSIEQLFLGHLERI